MTMQLHSRLSIKLKTINFLIFGSLSYRNQSIDLQIESTDWFLYDRDVRHEKVKGAVNQYFDEW